MDLPEDFLKSGSKFAEFNIGIKNSTSCIFTKGGKPENPEENPRSTEENQQTTVLT